MFGGAAARERLVVLVRGVCGGRQHDDGRQAIGLSVDCGKVKPESGCSHVIQADSEDELTREVAEHAQTHNLEPTPELVAQVKQHIQGS